MTPRDRILAVFHGKTPDIVPFMLDLSHWFYHRNRIPFDLSQSSNEPERELIAYHKKMGVAFYLPLTPQFYSTRYAEDVRATATKKSIAGRTEITWRLETPLGTIERKRQWEEESYSWAIRDWGVKTDQDLKVLACALAGRSYASDWSAYQSYVDCVGQDGVVYMPAGYSAMGYFLSLWMGIEGTTYAICDRPDAVREAADQINENTLKLVDLLAASPAEIIVMGDNFSSDIQPPAFFDSWSKPFYAEAVRRLHAAGKHVAVHVDGRLRGLLGALSKIGVDAADAVTPAFANDLSPAECRAEAGPKLILSGGVAPNLWNSDVSTREFAKAVKAWLDLRKQSPALIAAAGDQVPPGAPEDRIEIMRDLVAECGRFT